MGKTRATKNRSITCLLLLFPKPTKTAGDKAEPGQAHTTQRICIEFKFTDQLDIRIINWTGRSPGYSDLLGKLTGAMRLLWTTRNRMDLKYLLVSRFAWIKLRGRGEFTWVNRVATVQNCNRWQKSSRRRCNGRCIGQVTMKWWTGCSFEMFKGVAKRLLWTRLNCNKYKFL